MAAASPMSQLGVELSDDSLTLSPEQLFKRGTTLKRASGTRGYSAKRLAVSLPRSVRKASPSPANARKAMLAERTADRAFDPPRDRGSPSAEERLAALEKAIREQAQMGVELRRDVYGKFGAVSNQVEVFRAKFDSMETLLDAKVTEIDVKLETLRRHIEKAEAQLPTDGRMVAEGFNKLAAELDALKNQQGETFTKGMIDDLELMRQHVIAHEQALGKMTGGAAHFQMLADGLGAAMSMQDGRVSGLEQHAAQLASSIEALRSFQECQYPGTPPMAAFSTGGQGDRRTAGAGGGFPVGGGLGFSLSEAYSGYGAPGGCGGAPGDQLRPGV